jgi:hypothetical protein
VHQRGHHVLEHHPARHPAAVAAQRMPWLKLRELTTAALIEQGADPAQAGSSRHDGTTGPGHLEDHRLW